MTNLKLQLVMAVLLPMFFQAAQAQTETVLHSFANSPDGANPRYVTPVLDTAGNLYGTTEYGGTYGFGTVFEVTPSGTKTVCPSWRTIVCRLSGDSSKTRAFRRRLLPRLSSGTKEESMERLGSIIIADSRRIVNTPKSWANAIHAICNPLLSLMF